MTRPDLTVVPEPSRLRVITAGDVGNVHSRLGSSGFDVVAVVDTEAELVVAVSGGEPDAIVVEADLCESLEHVRELAPDATLIVVGDHTPIGAMGHIDKGVSATVLAGLLHALAAGGANAAVAVPGFVLATTSSAPVVPPVRGLGVRQAVTAGVVGSVVVAAIALGVMARSPSEERATDVPSSPPPVISSPVPPPAVTEPTETPSPKPEREPEGSTPAPAVVNAAPSGEAPGGTDDTPGGTPATHDVRPSPRPPGHAYGWDDKADHDDNGLHKGWSRGKGPNS